MKRATPEILDTAPPHDKDIEADFLACPLIPPSILPEAVEAGLSASHFYDPTHAEIARGMLTLHANKQPCEAKLLLTWLKEHTTIEHPSAILSQIIARQATAIHWPHYLELLTELRLKRELRLYGEQIVVRTTNGQAGDVIFSEAREALECIEAQRARAIQPIAYGKLADDNPRLHQQIIGGLLREGESANLVSHTKIGKSWLSNHLGLCVVVGRKFLDTFPCAPGRVLLIDNELHAPTIAFRLASVADAMEIPCDQYRDGLDVLSLRGRLMDLYGVARLLESVKPETYQLIMLDAWYRSIPKGVSENDNAAVAELYNVIDSICERLKCGWVNIHHTSKGAVVVPPEVTKAIGSLRTLVHKKQSLEDGMRTLQNFRRFNPRLFGDLETAINCKAPAVRLGKISELQHSEVDPGNSVMLGARHI